MKLSFNPMNRVRARRNGRNPDDTQPISTEPRSARSHLGRGLVIGAAFGAVLAFGVPALAGGADPAPASNSASTSSKAEAGGSDGKGANAKDPKTCAGPHGDKQKADGPKADRPDKKLPKPPAKS